jgi:hypothetical protein
MEEKVKIEKEINISEEDFDIEEDEKGEIIQIINVHQPFLFSLWSNFP